MNEEESLAEIIRMHPKEFKQLKDAFTKMVNFLTGQVMKNPENKALNVLLVKKNIETKLLELFLDEC